MEQEKEKGQEKERMEEEQEQKKGQEKRKEEQQEKGQEKEKEGFLSAAEGLEEYLQNYCLHQDLFQDSFREDWLDKRFLRALSLVKENDPIKKMKDEGLIAEIFPDVYSLPIFTSEVCNIILEEKENYLRYAAQNNVQVYRPNSMNKYGLVLNQMGMLDILTNLQQSYLLLLSRLLFPIEASRFTSHHSFIVSYSPDTDKALDMHTDDSDITWNICLGRNGFVGSGLTFCGVMAQPDHRKLKGQYSHQVGHAVVHLGSQRHGADSIVSGERHNLIMWCKNEDYRNSAMFEQVMRSYLPEEGPPDPLCLSYTHDRDYLAFREYPEGTNPYRNLFLNSTDENAMLPWCPPANFGYKGILSHNKLMLLHYERECAREDREEEN